MAESFGLSGVRTMNENDEYSKFIDPIAWPKIQRVTVKADGDCGAHVLQIVHYAMTHRALPVQNIRVRVYKLGCHVASLLRKKSHQLEFEKKFLVVAQHSYLNQTEMVLYMHAHNLNVAILSQSNVCNVLIVNTIETAKGWVFLLFNYGCHWELLGKTAVPGQNFRAVWSLQAGTALMKHISERARVMQGENPIASYTAVLNGVPLFRLDFEDRLWARNPVINHKLKRTAV